MVDIAAHDTVMMALLSDGRVLCWGANAGACGHQFTAPDWGGPPVPVAAADCVTEIFPGQHSMSAARLWDGTLGVWGPETEFEAGDGDGRGPGLASFQELVIPETLATVVPTTGFMIALATSGAVYYWGHNPPTPLLTPGLYPTGDTVVQVDASYAACMLTASGEVYCFGLNNNLLLGPPGPPSPNVADWVFQARQIDLPGPAEQVSVGRATACALVGGEVWCWGSNSGGSLGVPFDMLPLAETPVRIERLPPAKSLHVYNPVSCIVGLDDRVTCWGNGVLLGGAVDQDPAPEPWFHEFQVVDLAVGEDSACALLADGRLFCAGANSPGVGRSGFVDIDSVWPSYKSVHACAALGGINVPSPTAVSECDVAFQL